MKAKVNNIVLLRQLKKAGMCIRKNALIPILSNVIFRFEKDLLTISSNDLETIYVSKIDCECKEPFSVLIEYVDIIDICSNAVSPIQIETKDSMVIITSGKSKYNLSVSGEPEHYPNLPEEKYDVSFEADADFFVYLSNANSCKPKENTHPNFNMAAIDVKKNSVTVVGTDNNMLYKKVMDLKTKGEKIVMVCDMFVQVCKGMPMGTVSIGDNFIKVESGAETVISRMSEQKFCNYNAVIPKDIEYNFQIEKDIISTALKSITVAADAITKSFVFSFEEGKMKLESQNLTSSKAAITEIEAAHKIPIKSICLNIGLLIHLLNVVDGEEIDISVAAENRALFMKPQGDNSQLLLLQPIYNNNN